MKPPTRLLIAIGLALCAAVGLQAQTQPVLSVAITHVDTFSGSGGVAAVTVTNGGSQYVSQPTISFVGGGGVGAQAHANISGGLVQSITVDAAGSGYTSAPSVQIVGGGGLASGATATALLSGTVHNPPNEASGPYGSPINIWALATGTFPQGGFNYTFFVDGISIGSPGNVSAAFENGASWTPPQPGAYFLTAKASDGSNQATSLPIRYFATGTVINSPVTNTLVPVGSTVVLKADATVASGFIKQIQFFDNGVAIGSPDMTIPYSIIYTVPGAAGSTHAITAAATDNNNVVQTQSLAVNFTVVNAIAPLPTSSISSPQNNTAIAIPTDSATNIPVSVDASSSTGKIQKVELYLDGQLFGTSTAFPYSFDWHPTVVGTYKLVALTYDDKNNVVASNGGVATTVTIAAPPTVTVTVPSNGGTVTGGSPTSLSAVATDSNSGGSISSVQFFVDSVFVGQALVPTSGNTYSVSATLAQKTDSSGAPVTSVVTALATNNLGISAVSPNVNVNVTTGGSGSGAVIGVPPSGVTVTSPAAGATINVNTPVSIVGTASDTPPGTIANLQFFVNGQSVGSDAIFPYNVTWTPVALGTYSITVRATDSDGNVVTSSSVAVNVIDGSPGGLPTVTITSPTAGSSFQVGNKITMTATGTNGRGLFAGAQFFVNGISIGSASTLPFSISFTPSATGTYVLTATGTDGVGVTATSAPVSITVTAGNAPTITLTNPSGPTTVNAGVPITLAATATDSDGVVTQVDFLANNNPVGNTVTSTPYITTFTPTAAGVYSLVARATDNSGKVTVSTPVTLTVSGNIAPAVTITSPTTGTTIVTGSGATIAATATDSDGTISTVQFFANGLPVGSVSVPPYRVSWLPTADGIYRLSALAIDNAGAVTTSSVVSVLVTSTGGNAAYTGIYQNLIGTTEIGKFAMVTLTSNTVVYLAHSTSGTPTAYFFRGVPLGTNGSFSVAATATAPSLSGSAVQSNTTGNLGSGLFIGQLASGSSTVASGFYAGSLTGVGASEVAAVVGGDGSIMIYVTTGTLTDSGDGSLDSSGNFRITTLKGTTISGRITPSTGLLTATLTGTITGSATGAVASAQSFSDGSLRNLSTRGQVGTGADVLITGFVVGGTSPKSVLIRAVGPSLALQGISAPLAHPQLQVYRSNGAAITGAYNDRWSSADATAMSRVGAFALTPGTFDASVVSTFSPGIYTTQVSGENGGTGVALVEFYDLDDVSPFSTQKVMNVSTRGKVGSGENTLIAGFVVSGTSPKKLLIRAVGPTLASLGLDAASVISDPQIQLIDQTNHRVVRENDNWEVGNDSSLVTAAGQASGAFPLPSGSKDAVLLLSLPPGNYTAQVTGVNGATGIGLVEVYEVP